MKNVNACFLKRLIKVFVPILFLLSLWSCQSEGGRDIRAYYFPIQELQDGLIYEYQAVNMDSLTPKYWYYRSFINDNGVFLTGTYYEHDFTPLQFVREEMVSNGIIQDTLYLFEYNFSEAAIDSLPEDQRSSFFVYHPDSSSQVARVNVEILSGTLFPYQVRDEGGVFLYKVKWRPASQPETEIILGKTRHYLGDTTFTFQNKTYDCVRFKVSELFQQNQEGVLEQEYSGVEWYAKKLGLVYFRKNITEDFVIEYQLEDRYPMEKLEEKFKVYLEQQ